MCLNYPSSASTYVLSKTYATTSLRPIQNLLISINGRCAFCVNVLPPKRLRTTAEMIGRRKSWQRTRCRKDGRTKNTTSSYAVATRTNFPVRGVVWRHGALRGFKKSSGKIVRNVHAHSFRFSRTRFLPASQSRRPSTFWLTLDLLHHMLTS